MLSTANGWAQNDKRWATTLLGAGPDTIGPSAKTKYGAGCYLTTDADILTWMGHPTTPLQLNAVYKAKGIYKSGELLPDTALHLAYPTLIELVSAYVPAGKADLRTCDNSGLDYVTLFIRFPHGLVNDSPHFLPVWRYKAGQPASSLMVCDSYDGVVKPLANYGDPASIICKVLHLRPITQPKPVPVVVKPQPVTTAPVIPPAPTLYKVTDGAGTVIAEKLTDLGAAEQRADVWALTRPGIEVDVIDDKGAKVYSKTVAAVECPDPTPASGPKTQGSGCLVLGLPR